MESQKHIAITVSPEGEVSIEAVGFKGNACEKATAALEKAMGAIKTRTKKPEFFQKHNQEQKAGL
jgi:hypothetical protein